MLDVFSILREAAELLSQLHSGSMSDTAYDTAWVARVPDRRTSHGLAYPAARDWLLQHQREDGSWGGAHFVAHDRVVSTVAALVSLQSTRNGDAALPKAIDAGVRFLRELKVDLQAEAVETVGFELIMPTLTAEARSMGMDLPFECWAYTERLRTEKLRGLPMVAVYQGPSTLTHSLEYLGTDLAVELVKRCQAPNGSYGCSPSASAYVLLHREDDEAAGYLDTVINYAGTGAVCNVYPFEVFEKAWVLYNLYGMKGALAQMRDHLAALAAAWSPAGVGFAREGLLPDGDDTAVAYAVLRQHGLLIDPAVFKLFEADDYFFCFPIERNHSLSTNAHILEALKSCPASPDRLRMMTKAANYLVSTCHPEGYWQDKWHVSPYYATSEAVAALVGIDNALAARAIRWMVETRHADGGWGVMGGTAEETAMAVKALLVAYRAGVACGKAEWEALQSGAGYLSETLDQTDYPELWVGKGLYTPYAVVRSAILGALHRYVTLPPVQVRDEPKSGRRLEPAKRIVRKHAAKEGERGAVVGSQA